MNRIPQSDWSEIANSFSASKEKLDPIHPYFVRGQLRNLIISKLESDGALLIRNVLESGEPLEVAEQKLLRLARLCGRPTPHTKGKKDYIWTIRPRDPDADHAHQFTFSEHNNAVDPHTDSQYMPHPERYVCFLTVREASDGGGETLLLDFRPVLAALENDWGSKRMTEYLRATDFPIICPGVLRTGGQSDIINAKLVSDIPLIRFRADSIAEGLRASGPSDEKFEALKFLEAVVKAAAKTQLFLRTGDLLFLNNHYLLHGRTSFSDLNRTLLRVRFD
jgi:alpha-ketoglutarate-dependent taurine dioxygenase